MAVVNFKWHTDLKDAIDYVTQDRGPEDVVSAINCDVETAHAQFHDTKVLHGKTKGLQVFEMIQSFSPKESHLKTPEEFHELGRKLTERLFPGYEAVVRTHTDKGHVHTHIRINTVHPETGVRLQKERFWGHFFGTPKRPEALQLPEVAAFAAVYRESKSAPSFNTKMIHKLRRESDQIVKDAGLSVIPDQAHQRGVNLPEHVMRIERFRGDSWGLDLIQKASFARAYSTHYDEYCGALHEFGIDVRVEKKNISYQYPGKLRRVVRGKKLGKNFDKEGLEKEFVSNAHKFATQPSLKTELRAAMNSLHDHPGQIVRGTDGVPIEPHGERVISSPRNVPAAPPPRKGRAPRSTPELDLAQSMIPTEELRRAKRSIPEYCKSNQIALTTDVKGRQVLKGREHIVVTEHGFENTLSHTSGSLIDFVAIHQDTTYLQAIAKINQNPRLLLLEKHWGEQKRNFNLFYIPKTEQANEEKSKESMSRLLGAWNTPEKVGHALLHHESAQVSKNGTIRFFSSGDGSSALEFTDSRSGQWHVEKLGMGRKPFYSTRAKGKTLELFLSPKDFIAKHGNDIFQRGKKPAGILALLFPAEEPIDRYLAENRDVSRVVLSFHGKTPDREVLDFFGILKNRHHPHGIQIELASPEMEKTRERGPDLTF